MRSPKLVPPLKLQQQLQCYAQIVEQQQNE
jgi:hypothetical protein